MIYLLDPEDVVYHLYGGFGMPVSFFIDGQGNIQNVKHSQVFLKEIRESVRKLLSES